MKRLLQASLAVLILAGPLSVGLAADQAPVWITQRPRGLVYGNLSVPVTTSPDVEQVALFINGVPYAEQRSRSMVFHVPIGNYLRRLRIRAVGYDATGHVVGEDEIAVNDPQPPFRVSLNSPTASIPEEGMAKLTATVSAPQGTVIRSVEFQVGDRVIGRDEDPPWAVSFDPKALPPPVVYATATAFASDGSEAHDVYFWGTTPREEIDVNLMQLPLSVADTGPGPITKQDLTLLDQGEERPLEQVISASDLPLSVVLLIDSSESMMSELPFVKEAAKDFARLLVRPNQKIAVVGFAQGTVWLTDFTSDVSEVERAVNRLRPRGETHLYDAVIEMLFELQKRSGRRALVVLTDGVNQGGDFNLDHLIHYGRYAGVPVYPIIKNSLLTRLMRFGLVGLRAEKFASIARDSGATYFIVKNGRELPTVYRRIAEELRNQYLVLFYASPSRTDAWHGLSLETRRKGVFRMPRGYFP